MVVGSYWACIVDVVVLFGYWSSGVGRFFVWLFDGIVGLGFLYLLVEWINRLCVLVVVFYWFGRLFGGMFIGCSCISVGWVNGCFCIC